MIKHIGPTLMVAIAVVGAVRGSAQEDARRLFEAGKYQAAIEQTANRAVSNAVSVSVV